MKYLLPLLLLTACGDNIQPPQPNGSECIEDLDCEGELCLDQIPGMTFPDGYCSNECDWDLGPEVNYGCAEIEECVRHNLSGLFFCLGRCPLITQNWCREGYYCLDIGLENNEGVCAPAL